MAIRFSFVLLVALATAAAPFSLAQRRGGFVGPSHAGAGFGGRTGSSFYNHRRSDFGAYFWGDPFFWYGDDTAPQPPSEPASESGPPVLILRPDSSPQGKLSPLLIELEGDRYVRHGGKAQVAPGEASREPRTTLAPTPDSASNSASHGQPAQLAPTVLIFRDGHREQIPDYAIVGRVLYAHGDFDGEPGYGLKNIQVSQLDVPATIKVNRENGVSFVLPSGPNEVVTRP